MPDPTPHAQRPVGLVLTGGGARAAYQVGVLNAIARIARDCGVTGPSPFQVITGTSAGAINAAGLACWGDHFGRATQALTDVWANFHADQVYRADSLGLVERGAPWLVMLSMGWAVTRWRKMRPRSLLDNAPLETLLHNLVPFDRLPAVMGAGHVHALAVTASSYTSGQHVTFYECNHDLPTWTRSQRIAVRDVLGVRHLLASSAIPFVFPAVRLPMQGAREWFGDGSMRQAAPISPAIHLGAQRLIIVGSGRMQEPPGKRVTNDDYPSVAQIAGHALSNIFLDALAVDIERMQRINTTLSLLSPEARSATPLRPIEALVIAPSQRLDDLAAEHLGALPATMRTLLRSVGVNDRSLRRGEPPSTAGGSALASYLLFEADYTRALMALGQADTEARRTEVQAFFGWQRLSSDGSHDREVARSPTDRPMPVSTQEDPA